MGRPIKTGLDYFPLDVGFFDDDKISFVFCKFGILGEMVAIKLLCKIYKDEGYFIKWGDDEAMLFVKKSICDISKLKMVNEIVAELLDREFFDLAMFQSQKILTSHGIQERFSLICRNLKRIIEIKPEYDLLGGNPPFPPSKPAFPPSLPQFTPVKSTQKKGKEKKLNTIPENSADGGLSSNGKKPEQNLEKDNTAFVIAEQKISQSYWQKIVSICKNKYEAGLVFYRASIKAKPPPNGSIIGWIEAGLKPDNAYAFLPIEEECLHAIRVRTWVENEILGYKNEAQTLGNILSEMMH